MNITCDIWKFYDTRTHTQYIIYCLFILFTLFHLMVSFVLVVVADCNFAFFFFSRVHSLLFVCSFNRFLVVNLFHYSLSLLHTRSTHIYATHFFSVAKWMTFPRRASHILSTLSLSLCVWGYSKSDKPNKRPIYHGHAIPLHEHTTHSVRLNYDRFFSHSQQFHFDFDSGLFL